MDNSPPAAGWRLLRLDVTTIALRDWRVRAVGVSARQRRCALAGDNSWFLAQLFRQRAFYQAARLCCAKVCLLAWQQLFSPQWILHYVSGWAFTTLQ
jgi:hypothetical protein